MANYLLAYHGGSVPETPEAQAQSMEAWTHWFQIIASAVVDGDNPVARAWTIQADGTVEGGGANPVTGYSVIAAESMDGALALARGCPIIAAGGTVELCETFNIM
jgi:hypothetical protein